MNSVTASFYWARNQACRAFHCVADPLYQTSLGQQVALPFREALAALRYTQVRIAQDPLLQLGTFLAANALCLSVLNQIGEYIKANPRYFPITYSFFAKASESSEGSERPENEKTKAACIHFSKIMIGFVIQFGLLYLLNARVLAPFTETPLRTRQLLILSTAGLVLNAAWRNRIYLLTSIENAMSFVDQKAHQAYFYVHGKLNNPSRERE